MTREERIDSLKRRGFWFRPLIVGEAVTFHPVAARIIGAEAGIVREDSPVAENGLGSRMVRVFAAGAEFNVRRGYCFADRNKGEADACF